MKGRGLKIFVKPTNVIEFLRVLNVKSYSPAEQTSASSEKKYLDQDDSFLDHSTGLVDPGEMGFGLEYDPANDDQKLLESSLGQLLHFKILWRNGSSEYYTGSLTKRSFSEPNDDDLIRNYSVKCQGEPESFDVDPIVPDSALVYGGSFLKIDGAFLTYE